VLFANPRSGREASEDNLKDLHRLIYEIQGVPCCFTNELHKHQTMWSSLRRAAPRQVWALSPRGKRSVWLWI